MRFAGGLIEILLIEQCHATARATSRALRRAGVLHRLTWLASAEEGREFLRQDGKFRRAPRPDLVLIGGSGARDGYDLLAEYAADSAIPEETAVVVIGGPPSRAADGPAGVRSLPVPLDPDRLVELVRGLRRAAGQAT